MEYKINVSGWRGAEHPSGSNYAPSEYSVSEFDPQEEENWDDWEREDQYESDPQCLFCPETFSLPEEAFAHCKDSHDFDFLSVKRSLGLDFYKCIRMINYIRKQVLASPLIKSFKELSLTGNEDFWEDDQLLQPVLENDALLFAFEELEAVEGAPEELSEAKPTQVDLSKIEPTTALEKQLLMLLAHAKDRSRDMENQFEEYKTSVQKIFMDNFIDDTKSERSFLSTSVRAEPKAPEDSGNYYFEGYAQNDIHEQMLKDRARTEAYRDFMYENKDVFKDKIVLDVGCGTGILSMFAAKAGAKKVFAVDNSAIAEKARMNIAENGLSEVITVIRGKIEEIQLPVPTVDIIVSEWMGYFLLFEAMFDSVLTARDRWLAPGGILAPSHARILMAALDDEDWKNDRLNFWDNVYGFKMSAMKEPMLNEAVVDFFKSESIISNVVTLKDLHLQKIGVKDLDFGTRFEMKATRDGAIYAFGGWFDTWFTRDGHPIPLSQEAQHVEGETLLSTSPYTMNTHWKQTIFVLEKPIQVKRGTQIRGLFTCKKGRENVRELECNIQYTIDDLAELHVQTYTLRA